MVGYRPYGTHRMRRSGFEFKSQQSGNSQFDKGPQLCSESIQSKKAGKRRRLSGR